MKRLVSFKVYFFWTLQNSVAQSSTEVIHNAKRARLEDIPTDNQSPYWKPLVSKLEKNEEGQFMCSKDLLSDGKSLKSTDKTEMNSSECKRTQASETQHVQSFGKVQREMNLREINICKCYTGTLIGKQFQISQETNINSDKPRISCEIASKVVESENFKSIRQRETVVDDKPQRAVDCFSHDICLSQIVDEKQLPTVTMDIRPIVKPSEFYTSFKKLCNGLKIHIK